jgi:type I restriction enzyme R subunit
VLADLAGFAERYAHEDPASSLIKQRSFVEHAVAAIYELSPAPAVLRQPQRSDERDRLPAGRARGRPEQAPRRAQGRQPRRAPATAHHQPALARVLGAALRHRALVLRPGRRRQARGRAQVHATAARAGERREDEGRPREAAPRRGQVRVRPQALDEETKKRLEAERAATEATRTAEENASELTKLREAGQKVASALEFNEATTRRRLIDQALLAAGWNVGVDGKNTEQVKQELKLTGLPTPSGDGFADYVLYGDDGKPLAVIEAKKTAKDARAGGEQARQYADALEKATGVRPVVFFTNGIDVFLWDDAQGYPYRKVYGFYSKDSLEYLVHQRTGKKALAHVEPNLAIANRMYQLEAVKRVCERFERQLPQGPRGAGHRHRQDARRHLALRRADARGLGEAHPLPLRPQGAAPPGRPRLQGVHAR